MSRTHVQLKAAASQLDWPPDIEVLVIGGYVTRLYPELDPDKFANATSTYAHESGLPIDLITKILCGVVDEAGQEAKDGISPFTDYLAGVVNEFRKLNPEQEAAAQPTSASISVPKEITCDIDNLLKSPRPMSDAELGDSLFRWNAKLDKSYELHLDVINAEPSPALAIMIVQNGKTLHRHRPVRLKQWSEMKKTEEGQSVTVQWKDGQVDVVFRNQ